ncbi:DoxX family protein [Aeromicrobium sp.]|uniref:DoxX family protein n=1 Tax=Aeromicrobium sp. TaxID=1871063 RepID=UPI0030BAB21A
MNELDTAALILRIALGVTLMAHGWNHGFGSGGLAGTAGWFESIGLRPAKVHAAISAYAELAAGAALVVGLLVPFAAAAGIGIMTVAFVTVHRRNGFFIFGDDEGYEYVGVLAFALTALAVLGGGELSVDHALDLDLDGIAIGLGAAAGGIAAAAGLLLTCWRPPAKPA